MILTREVQYALALLSEIGEGCGAKPLSLSDFAKKSGISFLFLQRIARKLKRADIILARKGKVGGYWLARPRNKVSVKDVLDALSQDFDNYSISQAGVPKLNKEIIEFLKYKKISDYA